MGPLEAALPWSNTGLDGTKKWLDRVERAFTDQNKLSDHNDGSLDKLYHATVKKVTSDVETLNFNTAVSQMMIFINECFKVETIYKDYAIGFIKMFACFAPHYGEELFEMITGKTGITYEPWPTFNPKYLIEDEVEIVVQVNGKVRGKLTLPLNTDQATVEALVKDMENLKSYMTGVTIIKTIYVKDKLINMVVR
jgi:leucyl-tRNA synthetase